MEIHRTKSSIMSWCNYIRMFFSLTSEKFFQILRMSSVSTDADFSIHPLNFEKKTVCVFTGVWLWMSGLPVTLMGHYLFLSIISLVGHSSCLAEVDAEVNICLVRFPWAGSAVALTENLIQGRQVHACPVISLKSTVLLASVWNDST